MKQGKARVEQYLPKVLIDELKPAPPRRQYTAEPLSGGCLLLRPDPHPRPRGDYLRSALAVRRYGTSTGYCG
jgi:hypothetical protein